MDLELTRVPRRNEPINLQGVFLKSVFFMGNNKQAMVGMFKDRGDRLGILFRRGRKGGTVFWLFDIFNQFAANFDKITQALEANRKLTIDSTGREDIKVVKVFGKMYVQLYDGEHSLTLNQAEWGQFIANLPLIRKALSALFTDELLLQQYIRDLIEGRDGSPVSAELPALVADRLFDEVTLYKLNGGGGGG